MAYCRFCRGSCNIVNHTKIGYVCVECLREHPKKKPRSIHKKNGYIHVFTDASFLGKWCGISYYSPELGATSRFVRAKSSTEGEYIAMLFAMSEMIDFDKVIFRTDCAAVASKRIGRYKQEIMINKFLNERYHWEIEEIHETQNWEAHVEARKALRNRAPRMDAAKLPS